MCAAATTVSRTSIPDSRCELHLLIRLYLGARHNLLLIFLERFPGVAIRATLGMVVCSRSTSTTLFSFSIIPPRPEPDHSGCRLTTRHLTMPPPNSVILG